ncbi:hypothetical protein JFU03_05790 [Bacillus sp. TH44]|uniref:hypothetical protein n=1 Tax=Bacillus TaxID=1386 RepID=UPI001912848C|nr:MULTISPECIES: hypothetical protein [unclassified Bacillus (in: firmicutes)]MBK5349129.1 hypothetical protein [Bacillus sp. TH45]MBK5357835.1 hypothetical protein [Bacillus sp. TH44]MBK5363968.1 hypothetical protein [Bacillus sp. TH50]
MRKEKDTKRVRQKNTAEMKSKADTHIYDPKEATGTFYRLPQDIEHYQWIDGYKIEMSVLYSIIANYYRPKLGYAYPTQYDLMLKYNKSINVLRSHIRKLVEVGLLSVMTANTGGNHCYVAHEPLTQAEVFKKFPSAAKNYAARKKWIEEREAKDHSKLRELHEKFGKKAITEQGAAETAAGDHQDLEAQQAAELDCDF